MKTPARNLQKRLQAALSPRGAIAEFCRKTEFSRSAVENWRDGTQFPGVDKLDRIAEALNTTPEQLLSDPDDPTPLAQVPPDIREMLAKVKGWDSIPGITIRAVLSGLVGENKASGKKKA